ncbi:beta-lactamase class A [Terriglobus roseus DSM 18391]|uniref:beta-lactamase n=1 Tax=Terriglobus roseus (strain DSM 18391 / NRRL B-41598 / KBS 63) TaxID=926566 RepID=I3ZHL4_TERRK|nr:serine hydrolase [Terriglobus roseus]AFL88392.1 beta-lactamase class A [Terriglobus roseus DSM 18391]AFL88732.1 beta-lactamase class A [Terriglobus roseus DSM 18391]
MRTAAGQFRKLSLRGLCICAALTGLCTSASAQEPDEAVKQVIAQHHGSVALYAHQLNTGKTISIDADKPVQTASTIKLALLWTAVHEIALGHATWDEKVTLKPGEGVAGSGILHFFDTPITLTLKDIATMMVIVSDNTATNLMIDRFPTKQVDGNMTALGYTDTWLYKKVFKPADGPMPADQPKFGLGKTTPHQIAQLIEKIGRCDVDLPGQPKVNQAKADTACNVAIDMLRNQFYRDTIPRYLETLDNTEKGSGIASKTGSLDATRSDVAILAAKSGPIVLAVYTYDNADKGWSVDNEGEVAIAKIAQAVVKAWSPAGIDGKSLTSGLGLPPGTAKGASK